MAGGIPHQGLIAVVSAKPVISVEKILEEARTPGPGGGARRRRGPAQPRAPSCARWRRAGADGVLLPDRHSAGLSETVSRASAGGLEHVKVASIGNVVQAIEALKATRPVGGGLRRQRHRALGRRGLSPAHRARPRGRGPRHPPPRARALRPPRLHPALRAREFAERVGGGGHRAVRDRAAARRGAQPRAPDPHSLRLPGPASSDRPRKTRRAIRAWSRAASPRRATTKRPTSRARSPSEWERTRTGRPGRDRRCSSPSWDRGASTARRGTARARRAGRAVGRAGLASARTGRPARRRRARRSR